ncbi:MAG TPA: AAA domain-containing protein [Candidatus Thermoplasmatota archaeon]|nr:AAA domain-containing protein [Candidatus Thermoplasmatota archaeon]
MPKQMSGKTFSRLLDYYIACLEQEDKLSVTFTISSEGTQFVSTPLTHEELFHTSGVEVTLEDTPVTQRFFQTSLLRQKHKTLFYGYPIVVCPEGKLSPLFCTELSYERRDHAIVIKPPSSIPRINPYPLMQQGYSTEEIMNLTQEIETTEFSNMLVSLCDLFHVSPGLLKERLDPNPLKHTIAPTLVNKAILYFGERTGITHNLIVELRQLQRRPLDDLSATSLLLLIAGAFHPEKTPQSRKPLLEIFLLNPAQQQAVQQALSKSLSVITGPPGTGKSQVVLNIIANAVYQNKTVLFASKNNKAVDVVLEKFQSVLPYKLIVRMGHRAHRKNAKSAMIQLMNQSVPRCVLPEKKVNDLWVLASRIQETQETLHNLSALNTSLDNLQDSLENLIAQLPKDVYEKALTYHLDNIDTHALTQDLNSHFDYPKFFQKITTQRHKKTQDHLLNTYSALLPSCLRTHLQNHIMSNNLPPKTLLQWLLSLKKIELTQDEISQTKKKLFDIPDYPTLKLRLLSLHEQYLTNSRPVLEEQWVNRLSELTDEDKQAVTRYFTTSEQLELWTGDTTVFKQLLHEQVSALQKIQRFLPVWVVTNLSAKHSFPLKSNLFDILIIDEASQCDIVSALPLFYRAKQVVIIGDPNQLSHVSLLTELQDRTLAVDHDLDEAWFTIFSYTKRSLYWLAAAIVKTHKEQPVLLNEHYRCHSDIISFSNEYYYGRKLAVATNETRLLCHPSIPRRIVWCQIKGKTVHAVSPYNTEEAEKVVEEILKILGAVPSQNTSLGVVTLFRAQTETIAEKLMAFQGVYSTPITIGTAHRFQGDEKDIIVFSPAVSEGVKPGTLHWIETTRQLINVAVTRARSYLIIVGDRETCTRTLGPLNNLAEYVETRMLNTGMFDSPIKQHLYDELMAQRVPIASHYIIKGSPPIHLDFALSVNGIQYAIELIRNRENVDREQLKENGWKIRRFLEDDVINNLPSVIEEIKRCC